MDLLTLLALNFELLLVDLRQLEDPNEALAVLLRGVAHRLRQQEQLALRRGLRAEFEPVYAVERYRVRLLLQRDRGVENVDRRRGALARDDLLVWSPPKELRCLFGCALPLEGGKLLSRGNVPEAEVRTGGGVFFAREQVRFVRREINYRDLVV